MQSNPNSNTPLNLFYSYAHEDEKYRIKIVKALTPLKHKDLIAEFHDRKISAGKEWEDEIDINLEKSSIILLLISIDFLASKYCIDKEMTRALEKHKDGLVSVIPIILRPCDWRDSPFKILQALPRDGKPISKWRNRDEAYTDITRNIKKVVYNMTGHIISKLDVNKKVESSKPVRIIKNNNRREGIKEIEIQVNNKIKFNGHIGLTRIDHGIEIQPLFYLSEGIDMDPPVHFDIFSRDVWNVHESITCNIMFENHRDLSFELGKVQERILSQNAYVKFIRVLNLVEVDRILDEVNNLSPTITFKLNGLANHISDSSLIIPIKREISDISAINFINDLRMIREHIENN